MNLLFRILRAAHASGTHHKLALDALALLDGPRAERWQRLMLANARQYLTGAKAPDDEFKDFKNHVLHPRDDWWGGAPEKARNWYGHLLEALRSRSWDTAAYCAGVLSHYYTDPIHPFHTAQSEAENSIHRAVEWSICRSYEELRALGQREFPDLAVELPKGDNWLAEAVCDGALAGNRHYEKLIAHYDFKRGVVAPESGLDEVGRRIIAELVVYATKGFAGVLERAFAECEVEPADVSLTAATLLAGVEIPLKRLLARIADARERRLVEAMYDELMATGTVEKALPEDERQLRRLYEAEVLAQKPVAVTPAERFPLPKAVGTSAGSPARGLAPRLAAAATAAASAAAHGIAAPPPTARSAPDRPMAAAPVLPAVRNTLPTPPAPPVTPRMPVRDASPSADAQTMAGKAADGGPPQKAESARPSPLPDAAAGAPGPAASAALAEATEVAAAKQRLGAASDVVDAPAIGPKTAERLRAVGIATIADLIAADAGALSEQLDAAHVSARTVRDWQDATRLAMAVPGLRGTDAQILVATGCRSIEALARADAGQLADAVAAYCASNEGQRLLRSMKAPERSRVTVWIAEAKLARVQRAA